MTRALSKLAVMAVLIVGGAFALARYLTRSPLAEQLELERAKSAQLQEAVDRLTADHRVAELLVTDQTKGPDGVPRTTLLMEEYAGSDGTPLPPLRFTIVGDQAHLEGTVISFDDGLVEQGDALRGHSICLFTRIFGDHQTPAAATVLDGPDRIGLLDAGADPRVTDFQRTLWGQFWHLADDADYRRRMRVRSAGGRGVWFNCKPGQLYTVVLRASGSLEETGEPLRGVYRDALQR